MPSSLRQLRLLERRQRGIYSEQKEEELLHEQHKNDNDSGGGVQGGKGFTTAHQHTYINMTSYRGPSTVWKSVKDSQKRHWCVPNNGEGHMLTEPAHEGLLFQRPVKTGSTTLTAIMLRMIKRYSSDSSNCKYRAMHKTSRTLEFGKRDRTRSYLWSVIRDPTKKAISRYFHFDVSIGQKAPTDEHFLTIMKRPYNQNDLTQQLILSNNFHNQQLVGGASNTNNNNVKEIDLIVKDILDGYDFIALTERMDESLVVFMHLLGLDLYDILYIKARSSGTFSNGVKDRQCVYLIPSFLTPTMSEFFHSEEWKNSNAVDIRLYQAVYTSLDNTILKIDKFQRTLQEFQTLQQTAAKFCENKVRSICDEGGTPIPKVNRTCIIWGEGCDFDCLAEFQRIHT